MQGFYRAFVFDAHLLLGPARTPRCQSGTKPGTCSAHCRNAWEYLNLRQQCTESPTPQQGLRSGRSQPGGTCTSAI